MRMVRRFELGANSFEVDVCGCELRVGLGKLNRPTLKPRVKASEQEALAEMEKLIAAHLARGYREVPIPPDPEIARAKLREQHRQGDAIVARINAHAAEQRQAVTDKSQRAAYTPAHHTELERQCQDGDPASLQVYADWLIEAGDPRGTIASMFLAGRQAEAIEMCRQYTPHGSIQLRNGFADSAGVGGPELVTRVRELCAAGVACTLTELRLGLADDGDWTPAVAAIAASPIATRLRALVCDASDRLDRDPQTIDEDGEDLYRLVAPVRFAGAPAWDQLPALERLTVDGPYNGSGLVSGSLREIVIRSTRLRDVRELSTIRERVPKLARLALYCPSLDAEELRELRSALGKCLVTKGDDRRPARYGAIVE
jgi:hypothetical protein